MMILIQKLILFTSNFKTFALFSTPKFFLVALGLSLAFHLVGKYFSEKIFQWIYVVVTFFYLGVLYPQALAVALFYLILVNIKKAPIALAIIPLCFVKIFESWHIIGISYMAFRAIQIKMDSDVNKPSSQKAIFVFLANPLTLLAGPIDRFSRFEENFLNIKNYLTYENVIQGWFILLLGIFQKFVLGHFWNLLILSKFDNPYSYTVFLYFDFAGYSAMAVGLSMMLGIILPMNFNKPWLTKNPQDLWRRFHITMGTFLNDYFFKPMYMKFSRLQYFKKRRMLAQNIALFCTFLMMGIWNGFHWHFVLSGAMFGLSSVIFNLYHTKFTNQFLLIIFRIVFLNYVAWALYLFSGKLTS